MKRTSLLIVLGAFALVLSACGQGNVFSLEIGTCFNDENPDGTEVLDVPVVDCSEAHDAEVFYLFDMPDGDFPGQNELLDAASAGCYDQFEAYVGRDYESSALYYWTLTPTSGSWDAGDREIACILNEVDGSQMTGSMKGSGV